MKDLFLWVFRVVLVLFLSSILKIELALDDLSAVGISILILVISTFLGIFVYGFLKPIISFVVWIVGVQYIEIVSVICTYLIISTIALSLVNIIISMN